MAGLGTSGRDLDGIYDLIAATGSSSQNVQGAVAHGAADSGNPVKVGAFASALASPPTAVDENDIVNLWADLFGRQWVLPQGNVAHDAPDAGDPVKVGAKAYAMGTPPAAVAANDRVDLITDLLSRLWIAADGTTAHDAVDTGYPSKMGGLALTGLLTSLPAAVANNDRTNILVDEYGKQHVTAGGITDVIDVTITRPSNTTQYAANDVIGDTGGSGIMTIAGAARVNAGSGVIVQVSIIGSAIEATKPDLELWILDTAPATIADNAAWAPSDAEAYRVIPGGVIDFDGTPFVTANSTHYRVQSFNPIPFKCITASKALYFVLVVRNTYTPVSAEVFTVRIGVSRD